MYLDNVWKELQLSVDHVLDKNLNSAKAGASVRIVKKFVLFTGVPQRMKT